MSASRGIVAWPYGGWRRLREETYPRYELGYDPYASMELRSAAVVSYDCFCVPMSFSIYSLISEGVVDHERNVCEASLDTKCVYQILAGKRDGKFDDWKGKKDMAPEVGAGPSWYMALHPSFFTCTWNVFIHKMSVHIYLVILAGGHWSLLGPVFLKSMKWPKVNPSANRECPSPNSPAQHEAESQEQHDARRRHQQFGRVRGRLHQDCHRYTVILW